MRRNYQKAKPKAIIKLFKSNEQILSPQVFLINEEGEHLGITETREAIRLAREASLDLVEVNPKANPPVAKIVNLGQLKYEREKKLHKQKVMQKKIDIKGIRLSFRISPHDLSVRLEQAAKFLAGDNKLKVELMLRGREKQHFDKARELIQGFATDLKNKPDLKIEEEQPLTRQPSGFSMILVNKK